MSSHEGATPRPWSILMVQELDEADAALALEAVNSYDVFRDLEAAARAFEQIDHDCSELSSIGALTDADDRLYGESKDALFAALAALARLDHARGETG